MPSFLRHRILTPLFASALSFLSENSEALLSPSALKSCYSSHCRFAIQLVQRVNFLGTALHWCFPCCNLPPDCHQGCLIQDQVLSPLSLSSWCQNSFRETWVPRLCFAKKPKGYSNKRKLMENNHQEIPENANEHCPGPQSESAGKSEDCAGCPNQEICATAPKGPDPDLVTVAERMATVKHKILVLSGKGGVGKSTFATQLSYALASLDHQVGLFDIDICGPSIPKMLGLEGQSIHQSNLGWSPIYVDSNLGVMSIGFMLENPDDAVIWKGPRKEGMIKSFLKETYWSELDYLIVDSPPGTSDEHISIVKLLQTTGIDGAIIVTTPQQVSLIDVRKEINFCKKVGVRVLGVVENMSGLAQSLVDMKFKKVTGTGEETDVTDWALEYLKNKAPELLPLIACTEVFDSSGGGALKMCIEMGVPFLGKVPMDPQLCKAAEEGRSCFEDQKCRSSAPALQKIVDKLLLLHELQ